MVRPKPYILNDFTGDCDLEEMTDTGIAGSSGQVIDFYVTTKEECLAYCVNEVCHKIINIHSLWLSLMRLSIWKENHV